MKKFQVIMHVNVAEVYDGQNKLGNDIVRLIEAELGYVADVEVVEELEIDKVPLFKYQEPL